MHQLSFLRWKENNFRPDAYLFVLKNIFQLFQPKHYSIINGFKWTVRWVEHLQVRAPQCVSSKKKNLKDIQFLPFYTHNCNLFILWKPYCCQDICVPIITISYICSRGNLFVMLLSPGAMFVVNVFVLLISLGALFLVCLQYLFFY